MPQAPEAMMPNENLILTLGQPAGSRNAGGPARFQGAAALPEPTAAWRRSSRLGSTSRRVDPRPLVRL